MVSLSVDVLNGATCPTTTTVTLDTGDSLLVLKKRLCAATGLPATTLKLCCAGKVTHLLRSTPPAQTLAAAKAFDTALLHAYEALAALVPLTTN